MLNQDAAPEVLLQQQPDQPPEEHLPAIASVPWVAVALAVHAILLIVAWFILPTTPPQAPTSVITSNLEQIADPPPPVMPPDKPVEFPEDSPEEQTPVEDKRVQVEDSTHAEDPNDSPSKDLAENPNPEPSDNESAHPNRESTTSAVGLAGGAGGGGGQGGPGGAFRHRPGPGGGVYHPKRVDAALQWLADHQNIEGHWSATGFGHDSTRKGATRTGNVEFVNVGTPDGDQGWESTGDIGLTALSILAFTGAGYDHKAPKFGGVVRQAALYLRRVQGNDGCFGDSSDHHFVYNHTIATMAIAELFGISGEPMFRTIMDRAVDYILRLQNPGMGWRYDTRPGNNNDSSVTGWMVLTLQTCEKSGAEFDRSKVYDGATRWFELVTVDVNGYPKTGYDTPGSNNSRQRSAQSYDNNPSMDAIYVMSMLFMGKRDLRSADIRKMAGVCIQPEYLPQWKLNKIDYYYWYYASLALYQIGGSVWDRWENAMVKTLLDNQRGFSAIDTGAGRTSATLLDEHGSWDAVDAWHSAGGRVYSTAINCLTLQTYYRYEKLNR